MFGGTNGRGLCWRSSREGDALSLVSWESLIAAVRERNSKEADIIEKFYVNCKQCNKMVSRGLEMTGRPVRGRMYYLRAGSNAGRKVQVCYVGRINSHVFFPQTIEESSVVCNADLQEAPEVEQGPTLNDPARNQEYRWVAEGQDPVLVRVLNSGPCNSRVVRVDDPLHSFKVSNHQLTIP